MKRTNRTSRNSSDDLRPEYAFDYSKAKKNPYSARAKRGARRSGGRKRS
jgi:hypothetical protein